MWHRRSPGRGQDISGDDGRQSAGRAARTTAVREALGRLPREELEVLALAYFGRRTQADIAQRLGVPLGTVKERMFRGLRQLADLLRAGTRGDDQV